MSRMFDRSASLAILATAVVPLLAAAVLLLPAGAGDGAPVQTAASPDTSLDAWMSRLEGGWAGDSNQTPFGVLPFAFVFDRDDSGDVHAHTALDTETWIDLRFHRETDATWTLIESASIQGVGVQKHRMLPVSAGDGVRRWVDDTDPGFLVADFTLDDRTFQMKVMLRGKDHVTFDLARLPEHQTARVREDLAAASTRNPDGPGVAALLAGGEEAPAIRAARVRVAEAPSDGRRRLELARSLKDAIVSNPVRFGPQYSAELLATLQVAVELAPEIPEAYHALAGFYLEAPAIAGGSIDRAEEVARRLVTVAPTSGEALLAEIARRRAAQP